MPESYTEVTKRSWFSRLSGAFKGILFGFVLIGIALWVLFSNEGRAVRRAKALTEGAGTVVSVSSERVDPANEGKLLHTSGLATTTGLLRDTTFGVAAAAIHLERKVEMFQWLERSESSTEKKLGGGTETTTNYSYEKGWSSSLSRSGSFKVPRGHENPTSFPYEASKLSAPEVVLGAFRLSPGLARSMSRSERLPVESLSNLAGDLRWSAKLHDGGIYVGRSPGSPEIGDLRVKFEVVRPATVSIVAGQSGNFLSAKSMSNGGNIQLLQYGVVPADSMFQAAEKSNRLMSWILRFLGFIIMVFGFKRLLLPLSVAADVVPAFGRLVGAAAGFVAWFLAAGLSLVTIALAWLYHRPLLAVVLLLVAGAAFVLGVVGIAKLLQHRRENAVAS
jgi:hypothetical protein